MQSVLLKAKGLSTYPNALSEMPEGSLTVADNVIIDRNGVIEPRRGFQEYGTAFGISTDVAKQLIVYKDRILRHYSTVLQYDSNGSGSFSSFNGSVSETSTGLRIKSVEANGNLYFTTSTGVKRISAASASEFTTSAGYIRSAGGVPALDVTGVVDYSASDGFFYALSKVAYRITWAYKVANTNLIEGAPSSRAVITNYSLTDTGTVNLTFAIPPDISATDTQFYYRIYRTATVTASIPEDLDAADPGDEMNLVIEDYPTAAELTYNYTFTTSAANATSGATYTNNGQTFTVVGTITGGTTLIASGTGAPASSGTLTKVTGTGDATITFSAVSHPRSITVPDVTPEDFRIAGELLYTNEVSGDGILQSNYAPPIAKDITLFQNTVFYANTQTAHQLNLAMLSVSDLISGTSTFTITQGSTTNTYTFRGRKEVRTVTTDTFANTTDGGYFKIFSASNYRGYIGYFDKTGTTTPPAGADTIGKQFIQFDISAAVTANDVAEVVKLAFNATVDFTATRTGAVVTVTNSNNGNCTSASVGLVSPGGAFAVPVPGAGATGQGEDQSTKKILLSALTSPSQAIDETARSIVNIVNNNTSEVVTAFYMSGPDDVPGLILFKTRSISGAAFTLTANSALTGGEFSPTLPTSGSTVISTNEVELNALYYSKFQQPEAVPIVNKFNVGPKDKAILRILPLRESLFVLKEDGIYRVTGQAGSFTLDPFDNSAIILAADSAVVLNNQIYMLSTQGVITLSDTGVSVISRPIEDTIDRITSSAYAFRTNTFGVSYESDRAYMLWTVTNASDSHPTQCFRFNTFTQSWTRFPIAKTCGIVNRADDKLYLGAADENFIEQERKAFDRTDYADRQYLISIPALAFNGTDVNLSSRANVQDGDVLLQTQYLTICQFNQMLKKLDLDNATVDKDYFSTLGVAPGANFRTKLDNLAIKLDADTGIGITTFASGMVGGTNFVNYQTDYNGIVTKLNSGPSLIVHKNFRSSSGTIDFEALVVDSTGARTNSVEILYETPLIQGPIYVVRGVKVDVIYAPQSFGDPTIQKQIREGTIIFENTVFYTAELGYASDLSPNFEFVQFDESGIGDWGTFVWGEMNWDGTGSQVPLRTYIPRDKQRCRFLRPRFRHGAARSQFAIFGISLTFRPLTERAYRE